MSTAIARTATAKIAHWLEAPSTTRERAARRWESLVARTSLFDPVRTVLLPRGAAVVGVGGATLGGSGRTPLAIALARALVERGERVAFVAHGHGGVAHAPRTVTSDDDPAIVGDEALLAARALSSIALVFSGGSREERLALAATQGRILVVDRLLQTRPQRLARSLLAHDVEAQWGSGRLIPFGDLASPRAHLLAAADEEIAIGGPDARSILEPTLGAGPFSVDSLRVARVGLVTSMARPDRARRALERHGVKPIEHFVRADHRPLADGELTRLVRKATDSALDCWLLCPKSSVWLDGLDLGATAVVLQHRVELAASIVDRVRRCC